MSAELSDGGSFEDLALPLFDSLYNFARWLTRDPAEAEDLVQETYVKALRGFASFRRGSNFRAWMFRILRNTFLTSRTGLAGSRTVPIEEEDEDVFSDSRERNPETLLLARLDLERLERAIAGLRLEFREVLVLCDVEGLSYKEIAESLAIPIGTVMSRLARARRAVRAAMTPSATGL